jgi:transglutaminase-like putative cysteine protease
MLIMILPRRLTTLLCLVFLVVFACGCAREAGQNAPAKTTGNAASSLDLPEGETWDATFMQGEQVGHLHTVTQVVERDGGKLLQIESQMQMSVQRFGDQTAPAASFKTLETLDGRLVSFESQQQLGPTEQSSRGIVRDGQLLIETTTTGKTLSSKIDWNDQHGGFFALEHSLLRKPMQAGEQRTVQALAQMFNQLATNELAAREEEEVKLLDGTQRLLRIDVVTKFANGNSIHSRVWTDRQGQPLKTRLDAFGVESYRTTKERALAESAGAADLGLATIVRLERPLSKPHQTRRVRYEVTLGGEPGSGENDPAKVFPSGPGQQVKPLSARTAELIVTAVQPQNGPARETSSPPTEADRQPNNLVQSDHPLVVQTASEAAAEQTDPLQIARALERYVRANVRNKNFTQALATAADVARTREGDCTEHAVLLAALARARQIPARVAIGLVYVEALQGFGYHMWSELYVADTWVPFDGTLGQGGIGAAHIKLAHTNLSGGDAFSAFLPVAQVLGRLKIRVLEAE